MPDVSKAQFKAMKAAEAGHSTLGIPQSVGHEFSAATPSPKGLPNYVGDKHHSHTMHGSSHDAGDAAPHAAPVKGGFKPSSSIEALTGLSAGHKTRRGRHASQARKAGPTHPPHTSSTHATPSAKAAPNATTNPAANSPQTGHITTGAKAIESTVAGHDQHHSKLNAAMASGDHQTAKKHALYLANALHKKTSKKSSGGGPAPMASPSTPPGY